MGAGPEHPAATQLSGVNSEPAGPLGWHTEAALNHVQQIDSHSGLTPRGSPAVSQPPQQASL